MDFEDALKANHGIELNGQQREAVRATEGPVLLLAVPGSGKTTVVAARTAYMVLERGIPPQSILTLTFNRSARLDMEARFKSQIVLQRGIPFEMKLPKNIPLSTGQLSEEQFNEEIGKGLADLTAGKTVSADRVAETMHRDYGV